MKKKYISIIYFNKGLGDCVMGLNFFYNLEQKNLSNNYRSLVYLRCYNEVSFLKLYEF